MSEDGRLPALAQRLLEKAIREMKRANYGEATALVEQVVNRFGEHEPVGYRG